MTGMGVGMDVLATAGHVDHGKSALVRALTGMEPDRWAEERRRGLTIDLGFAWTTLPSGRRLAIVDVPGHERFVGNMLAGVGSVPAALLVVAADDGWSAQTAEHVAVLDALGVRHALLAVTKADLADPDPVLADARDRLAATSMDRRVAPAPRASLRTLWARPARCAVPLALETVRGTPRSSRPSRRTQTDLAATRRSTFRTAIQRDAGARKGAPSPHGVARDQVLP